MRRAIDLAAFREAPCGRCLVGAGWIHFCASPALFGVVFFGRPDRAGVELLARSLLVELDVPARPHASVIDARRLEGADAAAFNVLHEFVARNRSALRARVTRLAIVPPGGIAGAVVAGFYEVIDPPYPVARHAGLAEALAWLGHHDSALVASLDAIAAEVGGAPAIVGELRVWLVRRLADATPASLAAAATDLGLSPRTLQRRLSEAGTSFEAELMGARLREAQRRLLDTDDALTTVALDVGFASPQHFSASFRRYAGETPSAWRARRRSG